MALRLKAITLNTGFSLGGEAVATIVDVAKAAGVSVSTVSHVINKTRFVSEEVTQRVCKAIEELNYQPNAVARSLRTRRSRIIGVVVSDITNPFFTSSVRAIEDEALKHGYNIILCDTYEQPEREREYLDILVSRQVEGIIVSPSTENASVISSIAREGMPVVFLDREIAGTHVDIVECDSERDAYVATTYLINQGHSRIGIICGRLDVSTGALRLAGYNKALVEHGITVDERLVKIANYKRELAYAQTLQLLDAEAPPTSLLVCNNTMIIGALAAIRDLGVKIPDDLSLVGFDDPEWASLMYPPLTVVSQPVRELGVKATQLLIERIENGLDGGQKRITLMSDLVVRDSCRTLEKTKSKN